MESLSAIAPRGRHGLMCIWTGKPYGLRKSKWGELFVKESDTIDLHLKNIYAGQELTGSRTAELFSVFQDKGARNVKMQQRFYNLDAIISICDYRTIPYR
ncbi:MAG: hypothetical protein HYZ16_00535 [Bacteroidetes bacterium]|nr:hypothetical protein [Bacteroidota bacterium]